MHSRYQDATVDQIWSPLTTLHLWYAIERLVTPELPETSPINDRFLFDYEDARNRTGHEVYAFLETLDNYLVSLPGDHARARRMMHYGLTSSDLVDTATALQMRDTTAHLDWLASMMADSEAFRCSCTVVARTHGVAAGTTTLGNRLRAKFPVYLTQPDPSLYYLGKLSGATGTHLARDTDTEVDLLRQLGLTTGETTQVVYRGHWIPVWSRWLAFIETCEAICTDLRLMWSYGELNSSGLTRVGSSAMPHKRNPIEAEQVCGLARVARGLYGALRESATSWLERDLTGSCVERICIPDLAHLAAHCLQVTTQLLDDLTLSEFDLLGLHEMSEALLLSSTDLWDRPRTDLHARLRDLCTDGIDADNLEAYVSRLNTDTGSEVTVEQFLGRVGQYTSLSQMGGL